MTTTRPPDPRRTIERRLPPSDHAMMPNRPRRRCNRGALCLRGLDPYEVLAAVVSDSRPETTVFWSGAGVSADAPTNAPVGYALVERALEHAFEPGTAARLEQYYARLRLGRTRPRLETVLEVVRRIHGDEVLLELLSDLDAPPNGLHVLFARHLAAGGRHITTNFDTCIERAAPDRRASTAVVHVHGALGGADLGATLGRIERGYRRTRGRRSTRFCSIARSD